MSRYGGKRVINACDRREKHIHLVSTGLNRSMRLPYSMVRGMIVDSGKRESENKPAVAELSTVAFASELSPRNSSTKGSGDNANVVN